MDFSSLPVWAHALIVLGTFFAVAFGAKLIVDSAAAIAQDAGVPELLIGLTVVAFGTSAPEFGVTLIAAFEGQSSISVGNIVGSNIFNLGFILGGAALLRAIPTDRAMVWRDSVVLTGSTLLLVLLVAADLHLSRSDGLVLGLCLVAYLLVLWRAAGQGREVPWPPQDEIAPVVKSKSPWVNAAVLVVGLGLVVAASHLLVLSATGLARGLGLSEWVIAVTIVAAGTSVPELATTIAGVVRGHTAISAGNVIGSDIFNLLGVLGVAGFVHPMPLDPASRGSLMALSGMAILVVILLRSDWRLTRWEGFLLVSVGALRWVLDFAARA